MMPFYEIQKSDFTVIHNKREINFNEHMHRYIEILYVFEGKQHITVLNNSFVLNKGDAAVIFSNTLHSYYKNGRNDTSALIIIIEPYYLSAFFPSLEYIYSENPIIKADKIDEETRFAMNYMRENTVIEKNLGYTLIIFSNLFKLLETSRHASIPINDLTRRLIDYISLNYAEPLSRESLAKEFNVSKYHISRIFSEKFNMNLKSYLGKIRSEKAAFLIRTKDFRMTEICAFVGFESIRTFNRVFKQNMGMTPMEFKNKTLN